ncbi:MAG: SdpI family protein [Gordonia sp. (in: high G+C Gram-positive bacteria)]|uniref:SdpI family protein n=1 Tax=Gordonia sp. (in: high G+C Gram-positive bacteria) TaxID=84139 RepID=UPI0039E5AEF6
MYVLSLIAAILVFVLAAVWAVTGVAGLIGKLPGNRYVGVRTAETVRSPEAWQLAQRIAAPGHLGGAVALTFGGVAALTTRWGFLWALGGLAVGFLAMSVLSGVAIRAAAAIPAPESEGGCSSGCCSGGDGASTGSADGIGAAGGSGCGTGTTAGGDSAGEGRASGTTTSPAAGDTANPAADCGESSCGSCKLSGMCLPEDAAHSHPSAPSGSGTGR